MQLGSNLNHDVVYLDFGLTGSLEEIVMVAEFIARNRCLLAELEVSPDTLAVDVLVKVGPGGDFLGQRHTSRHLRSSQWRPELLNRMSHDRWLETGGLDLTEKARRKARAIVATHEVAPLAADLVARIDAAIAGL
jgi:trimethylamine--corrinoid protein Co-methyltransferase